MTDKFCAFPFKHLVIGPEGTARVCCITNDKVTEHGAPMSLNSHSFDEIWNSAYMRNFRRGMLKGERISACEACYQSEAATGQSYRTTTGVEPIRNHPVARADVVQFGQSAGFKVDHRPDFIKLEIGNLCNLKCRMCYAGYSSQIERDTVHNRWNLGIDPLHAIWRADVASIGPEPRAGVRSSGMFPPESIDGALCCWTDGRAIFNMALDPKTELKDLTIKFHPKGIRGQQVQVVVNGQSKAKRVLDPNNLTITVDVSAFSHSPSLTIEILSSRNVAAVGERERGVPLSSMTLLKRSENTSKEYRRPELLAPQSAVEGPWYMDDRKVFDGVFKSLDTLQRLYITGGEPLINERVIEILDHIVTQGAAEHVDLELSTNCTHIDPGVFGLFKKFRRAELNLSLDAIGDAYEYIRYPAKWKTIDENVRKLKAHNLHCCASPTVQIYNILEMADLYRYCDALDIPLVMNVLNLPDRLAIRNLPRGVRLHAAKKLRAYYDEGCRDWHKDAVMSLIQFLDQDSEPPSPELVKELMLFSNDLDAGRQQNIRTALPELVSLFEQDGYRWIDETCYADPKIRQRPARERDYAWL
jgi:MoaA/NifB/PqqE/SkfB family radical SAM enzyme